MHTEIILVLLLKKGKDLERHLKNIDAILSLATNARVKGVGRVFEKDYAKELSAEPGNGVNSPEKLTITHA